MKRMSQVTKDNIKVTILAAVLLGYIGFIAHTAVKTHDSQTAYNTTHYMAQDRNS